MFNAMIDFPFWRSLCAAMVLGLCLPVFGRHLVLGRHILLGLAVPQITMAGIAITFSAAALGWLGKGLFNDESTLAMLGGLTTGIPTLLLTAKLSGSKRRVEPLIVCSYLGSICFTNLLLAAGPVGEPYLRDLLHGRLLLVSQTAFWTLTGIIAVGASLSILLSRRIVLALIDPEYAQIAGMNVGRWRQFQLLIDGTVSGVSVAVAGPLVTFALLILPTFSAAGFARSLKTHLQLSCLLGFLGATGGFILSIWKDWPTGDCVTAAMCVCYVGSLPFSTSNADR